ncbi:monofunctional biosynthetic peptidoglycan transglycosylase [Shewanella sp.]|uniref:monofunctional biosynthetic peptidoglycan transglycosylase n=1 Tax=Shewanella TaxID=22 RepID=UPI001ECABB09|nr:monofunctional biosynthetic peptidoglycan transglycosylase [Shewanella sp.]MBZ4677989.1 monofunctional biosynthetic peptidoglycan transglycosylase [Shewanella sp.]
MAAKKGWFRRLTAWLIKLLLGLLILSLLMVIALKFVNPPLWSWRIERYWFPPAPVTQVQRQVQRQVQHQWQPLTQISANMQLAVIASEDQRFALHSGFDLKAIQNAIEEKLQGERLRGASTLSQQTAKNLFMWSSRSFIRKGAEAWFTLLLELVLDKPRILELYLNIVEFGPGIYGVEAAAQHYFHKSAAQLSSREAALLAALLPNPWQYQIDPPSAYMNRRADWIQQQMRQLGRQTLKDLD